MQKTSTPTEPAQADKPSDQDTPFIEFFGNFLIWSGCSAFLGVIFSGIGYYLGKASNSGISQWEVSCLALLGLVTGLAYGGVLGFLGTCAFVDYVSLLRRPNGAR